MDIWNACKEGNLEYFKTCIDECENIEDTEYYMLMASEKGHKNIVEFLLKRGVNIDAQDRQGETALMCASRYERKDIVKLLLDKGANIEARNNAGWTALMEASRFEHEDIVELLLDHGADTETVDQEGFTVLLYACRHEHKNIVELLLNRGANIEARNNNGDTALMEASWYGCKNIVELLLNRGANIEAQNKSGKTALMNASQWGYENIVKLLLDRGANIEVRDNKGLTAFAHAINNRKMSTVRRFIQLMVQNPETPYSAFNIPVSSFMPRRKRIIAPDYTKLVKGIVPTYMSRAVKDSVFGLAMQRDIKEILDGKTDRERNPLTKMDMSLLTKILNTFRSIDYTEREQNNQGNGNGTSPMYDMEL